jgi:hypothetical protein
MLESTYLAAINAPGVGTFAVEWQTTVKPAAAHKARTLRKVTTALVLTGVEFSKLAVNSERETGELPWGEWSNYPYVITHKGETYFRVNTVEGSIRTIYLVDGDVVSRDDFNAFLTPSAAKAKRPVGGTLTIKAENMRLVGDPAQAFAS